MYEMPEAVPHDRPNRTARHDPGRLLFRRQGAHGRKVTALKWTITTQERNALVETHLGCIWWTINKNRRLISAAGLDDEDVFQQLAIRMIRAVENYDPDKGKDLEQHIFAQLQYEVLNCKDAAKLYGIKGAPYGARDLTVSLDALVETGVQFCGGGWLKCLSSKPCAA
nr:MAG TPA: RNA polymerase sigma factor [Caudoviricetes sp.]